MKQILIFKTGETTCSEQPACTGSMCRFVRVRNFGTEFTCGMFDERLNEDDGWLQRLPECKEQFRGVELRFMEEAADGMTEPKKTLVDAFLAYIEHDLNDSGSLLDK